MKIWILSFEFLHSVAPLQDFWSESTLADHLASRSRRYYRVGWNRIRSTPLMGTYLDRITTEELDSLALAGSPSYVSQALRTLRRLFGKAAE